MTAEARVRHRAIISVVAVIVMTVLMLAGLAVWWHIAPLTIKHRADAGIVTQMQALYDSDPDHVQQAIERSGKTNIVIRASHDPGNHIIQEIDVEYQGFHCLLDQSADYDNPPPDTHGETIMVWIGRNPLINSFDPDSAVIINNEGSAALDTEEFPGSDKKLHITKQQIQALALRATWEAIDTVADNW